MKNFEKQIKSFAKSWEFEKANIAKLTLFTLNYIQIIFLIYTRFHLVWRLNVQGIFDRFDFLFCITKYS